MLLQMVSGEQSESCSMQAAPKPLQPAIESTIRRVINQRLKSNAVYWLQENAETMSAVRATLLCDRWEETLTRVHQAMARDRRLTWKGDAPDTSSEMNVNTEVPPLNHNLLSYNNKRQRQHDTSWDQARAACQRSRAG
jgi:hypothetical protein